MASTTNDKRLVAVNQEEEKTLNQNNTMYNSMIKDSQKYYDKQIDASKDWVDKQSQLQQEQTDFAIEKIEQQKDQANKDYVKEQSGAYVDWQKESNRYGANAEQMAASGFVASGYGESSQVSMYNTYQNRVATAREVYNKAVLNYDNAIKDARLQNSSVLAEIAYKGLQQQLELGLQGLQYKNQLLESQANKQLEIKNMYHQQYQDVLNQINTENALAEEIRQYNASLKLQQQQFEESKRQFNLEYNLKQQQLAEEQRQFNNSRGDNGMIDKIPGDPKINEPSDATETTKRLPEPMAVQQNNKKPTNSQKTTSSTSDPRQVGNGKNTQKVSTQYYQGTINPDASKFGTFSNGYQPKGVSGHGTLKKTGDYVMVSAQVKYGGFAGNTNTVKQNVWKAEDGTLWVWDGAKNRYVSAKK